MEEIIQFESMMDKYNYGKQCIKIIIKYGTCIHGLVKFIY